MFAGLFSVYCCFQEDRGSKEIAEESLFRTALENLIFFPCMVTGFNYNWPYTVMSSFKEKAL